MEKHVAYKQTGHLSLDTDTDLETLPLLGSVKPWQHHFLKSLKKASLYGLPWRAGLISGTLCPGTSMSPLQGETGQ